MVRAEQEVKTRRRITEAAVELHGTVGPANTRVADIARMAEVSRTTVYTHFPTDAALFRACSSHWAATHPFPDPADWRDFGSPSERLAAGLRELYTWYGQNREMLGKIFRDIGSLPALQEVMGDLWTPYFDSIVETLSNGWPVERGQADRFDALIRLVVDFPAWRSLRESGLSDEAAAVLAARIVNRTFPAE